MTSPAPEQVLGRVTLATGPEEFLSERVVHDVRAAVRSHDPEAEFGETAAGQLTSASLGELAAPSLFSSTRCVVVRELEQLPDDSVQGLLDYVAAPADDVALVLVHGGGQKGSGTLTKLRKLPAVTEHKSAALTAREHPQFVAHELRRHGARIDPDAAAFLVQAVGQDLRGLAAAADQLAGDADGSAITLEFVQTYFAGRAEVKSFSVADEVLHGRTARALAELRWALNSGTAPVLITSAMASGLRGLAKLAGAPPRTRNVDLIKHVGVPGWKLDILRQQLRGWDAASLGRAIRLVADTDARIKGKAHDAGHALERMVIGVAGARRGR